MGAFSIGIGGIVGGGIFATLGLAGSQARGATFLSFIVGGFVALLTTYSYVRLSLALSTLASSAIAYVRSRLERLRQTTLNTGES